MHRTLFAQIAFVSFATVFASAGNPTQEYKVLPPINRGNLSLFPIIGGTEANTSAFLTLDEGLQAGSRHRRRSHCSAEVRAYRPVGVLR